MPQPAPVASLLAQLERDGFVVVPSILSPEQLERLRQASKATVDLARSGHWPHVRVVGKQFPPWDLTTEHGIWGVQHLMKPSLPEAGAFTQLYFSDDVLDIAKQLLQCNDDDLVMELFNMLIRPDTDFELRWHRDDIPPEATAADESARLAEPAYHAQYNLALFDDDSLVLVPGSHRRPRTATERAAGPFESTLPGQVTVRLGPGDIAFYDNNILHRGVYDSAKERMTLHGSVGHRQGSEVRARNVLQHGIGDWFDQCDFSVLADRERSRAEAMRIRLRHMGSSQEGGIIYSLQG